MLRHFFVQAVVLATFLTLGPASITPAEQPRDLMSDTWSAIDGLGRELPGHDECGPPREDKTVGIFYFLWLGQHSRTGPWDITKLLEENPDDPQYGPPGHFHHWAEPEWGYYVSDDRFVIRKHMQALTDAGVDVLFFDVTNGFTYDKVFLALCDELTKMQKEGNATPKIAFLTNSASERVVQHLYETFYKPGKHREHWFMWQGKPLILSKKDGLSDEVLGFFTFRRSWAWSKGHTWFGDGNDRWPWIDHYPQTPGRHEAGVAEQVPVAVAQHPVSNIGRSFHDGRQPSPEEQQTDVGLCFAEQWKGALEANPKMVFITGWNEWVAQRFIAKDRPQSFLGGKAMPGETYFVDQYNAEFSRDIEPSRGPMGDNYYWQMIDGIRRHKGVRPVPTPSPEKTITIDGKFNDWEDVGPEYLDTIGDVTARDHEGWNDTLHYRSEGGRHDIINCKVARDEESVYFMLTMRSPRQTLHWPRPFLFIDNDANYATGWHGYDYIYDLKDLTFLSQAEDGQWQTLRLNEGHLSISNVEIEMKLPRRFFESDEDAPLHFRFHWAVDIPWRGDTVVDLQKIGLKREPCDYPDAFTRVGDSAPNRRFNYVYRCK